MSPLLELAKRCEQTAWTGDRELDCAIYNAIPDGPNRKAERLPMERWGDRFDDGWRTMWADRPDGYPDQLKHYTSSLDAAMRLVPEGQCWRVIAWPKNTSGPKAGALVEGAPDATGATPALALCAAVLKARAASVDRSPEGGGPEEGRHAKHESATAESGDAQPTPVSDPISNKGER